MMATRAAAKKPGWFLVGIGVILAAFTILWSRLASSLTIWSDEVTQMAVASGILRSGEPCYVSFDQCGQLVTTGRYLRGLEISQLTAWSYRLFGESTEAARLVPFVFTMASWLLYALYAGLRLRVGREVILTATWLFFAQSMVLEQALNDRIYAPMLFFMLFTMIALWELRRCLQERRVVGAIWWVVAGVIAIGIPTPRWHLMMLPIAALGVGLLWLDYRPAVLRPFQRLQQAIRDLSVRWKVLLGGLLLYGTLCTGAISSWLVDVLAGRLVGSHRVHLAYWDNLFGLLRYLLVLNVLIVGWLRIRKFPMEFLSWMFGTGVISGLVIGLLMTHNYIFYSRFFYLSVALASLGAAAWLTRTQAATRLALLLCYLLVNGMMSGVTLGWDRSNIKQAIAWLKHSTDADDIILTFNADLFMYGGNDLCDRTYPILSEYFHFLDRPLASIPSQQTVIPLSYLKPRDPNRMRQLFITSDDLKALFDAHPSSDVYFLYTDAYAFRDRLYQLTTGKRRFVSHNLYGVLKDGDVGESVLAGLRGCGVKRVDRTKLLQAIEVGGIGASSG